MELLSLFEDGPTNVYRVAKLRGWNYPTAHRYKGYCVRKGFLELDHVEGDKGLPAKFYRITEAGRALLSSLKRR